MLMALSWTGSVHAQPTSNAPATAKTAPAALPAASAVQSPAAAENPGLSPFGANLFLGNFKTQSAEGQNPTYVVAVGDRVAVNVWGALQVNEVFTVDGQGNVFLPGIGPVHLGGVQAAHLTETVRERIRHVYLQGFDVYTNLLTSSPIGVFVTGKVARPGRYAGIASDSILYFMDQAGGIDPNVGSYRDIQILHLGQVVTQIDLYDFLLQGKLAPVQLFDGDTILVGARGPVVELRGNVAAPALLEFKEAPVSGAEALAIVPNAARATEVIVSGIRDGQPFTRTLLVSELAQTQLRHGDIVTVLEGGRPETIVVRLEGEFEGPSMLSVVRGSGLVDVLHRIEVDPKIADTSSVHIKRASVARAQKQSIEDSLFRLERSALLALSNSTGEVDIRAKEGELMRQFITSARQVQPLGRVVTTRNGRTMNITLENDDVIVIPARTPVIRVGGEVQINQAVLYAADLDAEDYIAQAGGYTDRSDKKKVIVLHASAEVTVDDPDTAVRPGDEILVPPRVDRKVLQNSADVIQILYQIAVSAAVVLAI